MHSYVVNSAGKAKGVLSMCSTVCAVLICTHSHLIKLISNIGSIENDKLCK